MDLVGEDTSRRPTVRLDGPPTGPYARSDMRRPVMAVSAEARLAGTKRLRTVALVGHRSAGKTSIAELLLSTARVTREAGEVDRGTALLDWTAAERRRRQTLEVGTAWFEWGDASIQL